MGMEDKKVVMEEIGAKRVWMIVEDEPSLRMMLSAAMMLIWGVEPLAFDDGYDAMAWLDGIEAQQAGAMLPELALLDIRMPGPQGPEIAERLRKVPATAKIAIVMMTAYRLNSDERESIIKMANPQAMVSKPLPVLSDLKQTLEQAIASTRSGILKPIELKAVPKESQQRSGMSSLPSLEELTAIPKRTQYDPIVLGLAKPEEPTTAPQAAQPAPIVTSTPGIQERIATLKESQHEPDVSGTPSPKEPAAAPPGSQHEPGISSAPGVRELIAALKTSQTGPGASGIPKPKEPAAAPPGSQHEPGVSSAPGVQELIATLKASQPGPGASGIPKPEEPAAEPDGSQHGSGATDTPSPRSSEQA